MAKGLDLIPCIGGFLNLIALLFGLGMVVVTLFGTIPFPREMGQGDQDQMILLQSEQTHQSMPVPIETTTDEQAEHEADQSDST
jgi:hypothetical protein